MAANPTVWPASGTLTAGPNQVNLAVLNNSVPVHGVRVLVNRNATQSVFISYDSGPSNAGMVEVQPGQLWQDNADNPDGTLASVVNVYVPSGTMTLNGPTAGVAVWGTVAQGSVQ